MVPDDSGLPLSGPERDYVLSLAGPKRTVTPVPATFAQLQDAFAAGVYDGWHFTGHGAARDENPDRSKILLAGGDEFTPESLSGAARNVGVTHPVVFINACQVGRGGMGLTGIGGWATRFVQAGAGAFVGAYWSVIDESAFTVREGALHAAPRRARRSARRCALPGSRSARPAIPRGWPTRCSRIRWRRSALEAGDESFQVHGRCLVGTRTTSVARFSSVVAPLRDAHASRDRIHAGSPGGRSSAEIGARSAGDRSSP